MVSFFAARSPLDIKNYEGDSSKVLLDRSKFRNEAQITQFKRDYKRYRVDESGKLVRGPLP